MTSIARKNLFAEKARLAITVGGVGLSIMLIVVLWSLYQGWTTKLPAYIESVKADLWVTQEGGADMFHGFSLVPSNVKGQLDAVPGVAAVDELIARRISFDLRGQDTSFYLVGYDSAGGAGGPIRIVSGRGVAGPGEIVVDRAFAREKGVGLGDTLNILSRDVRVVGISADGNMVVYQYAFVNKSQARDVLVPEELVTHFLVRIEDPARLSEVRSAIEAMPGIQATPSKEFRDLNMRSVNAIFLPIIGVLVSIGVVVGVAVIALTVYTGTIEKSREYGLMKAVGASNWRLYRVVLEQAMAAGLLGYGLGIGLSYAAITLVGRYVPAFVTETTGLDMAIVLALALVMAGAASYVPVRRLLQINPAMVFKQ
jgi:putative ABC transport system permease protein